MKKNQLLAAVLLSLPTLATAEVGVSISIGEPGFYGHIEIGDYPRPRLIYAEPMIIERVTLSRSPIYLRVPPGHAKHWEKHCHEYDACARPVYFVEDDWYERVYVPEYQTRKHGHSEGQAQGHGKDKGKGKGKDQGHGKGHDQH